MEIWFVMCCVWGSCELPERYHHSWKVTVDCGIVMEHSWCDHRASFPSLPLAYGFAAEKQSTSVNKYFVMCLGRRGTWKPQLTFSPEHGMLRCPLLKWWTISPCCHMRFQFMAFPGALKQGIDGLVSPLCCAALLHPKGKMIKWCSSTKDWWCSGILLWQCEWCKVSSEAKLLIQIPMESHGWAALWKVGKGRYNNGLYWEIKKAVIDSCTGKSGLLKAARMCPDLLVVLGSSLPVCFATCASRSWGIKDSMTMLSIVTLYLEHFIWFI